MDVKDFSNDLDKCREPFLYVLDNNWGAFKNYVHTHPDAFDKKINILGLTPLHFACMSGDHTLVKDFLEMLHPSVGRQKLREKTVYGNAPLHLAILPPKVEVAETLLKYDHDAAKQLCQNAGSDEYDDDDLEPLLDMRNSIGETPVYRAASFGRTRTLEMFKKYVDLQKHFKRNSDKKSVLHIAAIAQHFETAVWLMKQDETLAELPEDSGMTCLQLLAKMPSAFRSQCQMGIFRRLLYSMLPDPDIGGEDDTPENRTRRDDIEGGNVENIGAHKDHKASSASSKTCLAIWGHIGKLLDWKEIGQIFELKKKHMFAEKLVQMLVNRDTSWSSINLDTRDRSISLGPADEPASLTVDIEEGKKDQAREIVAAEGGKDSKPQKPKLYTPLIIAASNGIREIVERIMKTHPQAFEHISHDGENVLHVAIKYRQPEIYNVVDTNGRIAWISSVINNQGYSALHQAATKVYYSGRNLPGPVLQLQDELEWFARVEKIVPAHYILHNNDDNKTAKQLFDKQHESMLREAREWIKETAQSCSAVAVLVATVVFAAAFTVPGGSNDIGYPIFLPSPIFLFFVVMDVAALSSSLASVVMFLSILTSPCEMQDFHASLPRKLTLGFTLLFFSLATTMLAFTATIFLIIRLEKNKLTAGLIYTAALLPITIFAVLQFPLYVGIKSSVVYTFKQIKKFLPSFHCFGRRVKKSDD